MGWCARCGGAGLEDVRREVGEEVGGGKCRRWGEGRVLGRGM